jgi:hypothetical protein
MSLGSNDPMKVIVLLSLTFWLMSNVECIIAKEVRVFMLLQIKVAIDLPAFNRRLVVEFQVYIHKDRCSKCSRGMIPCMMIDTKE